MKSIVTIGGGTGQFTLLSGLKKYPVSLTAIVSMSDSGGSTGILRDELGVLPPGDIRQCLVALSEANGTMRELFNFRIESGGMRGHSFGNIFLSSLEKMTGSFDRAVEVAGKVLAIRGSVVPVTTTNVTLISGRGKGAQVGEHVIDVSPIFDRASLRLHPAARANPKALEAIKRADCIVIGPGDLYTSIIPNLLVTGISQAIRRSHASVVLNCNLMNKRGHTDGFTVADYVDAVERYIGGGRVNCLTYNTAPLDPKLVRRYASEGDPVRWSGVPLRRRGLTVVAGNLVSHSVQKRHTHDTVRRSLIRHDPSKLAKFIVSRYLKIKKG